ncbi:cupredoxin domain-containing protein [Xenorhabdus sp. Vera]|uniref:cupredoxin domain-containing protein n=1 Tax=Xenorhabdus TaxID=626 RepID=UPI0019A9144D|nr:MULTISPECIES: cupredoxin domain-containing protein [unclassified Xenorhabdus]MBD2810912.1 cupredoxin domain-containing protein [Xenorhabdus sp. Vera]
MKSIVVALCIAVASVFCAPLIAATEKFTVEVEMNNGKITPQVLEVPAKTPIRIKIRNTGTEPVEFESTQLRKEKVLAPGASSVVVIAPLKPGKYTFFDDFHLSHPAGEIIAN